MLVIHPKGRGNVSQKLTWKCGVPLCRAEEVAEEIVGIGEAGPDPMLEGPEGWRLVHHMWICPKHWIGVRIEESGPLALKMRPGTDHWEREELE